MASDARGVNDPSAVVAAALLTSICLLPLMLIPYLVGAAARDFAVAPRQLGVVAGGIIGGVIAVMASSVLWVRKFNWRVLVVVGACITVAGYLLAGQVRGFGVMAILLFIASCGSGLVYAPAICALSDTANPDRSFGYSFFLQILVSGVAGFIATELAQRWGLSGLLNLLAVFFALALVLVLFLPARGTKSGRVTAIGRAGGFPVWAGLTGMLLLNAGPMAVWTFFERIGNAAGFSEHAVGNAIAICLLMGAPGALVSSTAGKRFGRILPLAVSTIAMVATFAAAVVARNLVIYLLCGLLFQFLWNFGLAFQYGAMSVADVSGRLIVLAPTFQGVGSVAGPAVAGMLIHGNDYAPVAAVGGLCAVGGLILILWLCRAPVPKTPGAFGIPPNR
jgi:predicted MFS family arabinose efflux permease